MASDFYLKLDGIDGESRDKIHPNEIELESWQFGVSNDGSRHGLSGGGTGKAHVQDITFSKYADKASPNLFGFCVNHKDIPNAVISCYKAAGDQRVKYLEIELEEVLISSYQESAGSGGIPMESGSLNFAKIAYIYTMQATDQAAGGPVTWEWSVPEHA